MPIRLAFLGTIIGTMLLMGCESAKTPQDVTADFWNAVKSNDQQAINALSIVDQSSNNLSINGGDITRIKIIDTLSNNDQASVMTYLYVLEDGKEQLYRFNTLLVSQNDVWKVNRDETVTQLFAVRFKDIKDEITSALQQGIGNASRELRKKLEQINANSNNTGASSTVDEELEKLGIQLEKSLEGLGAAMADTIKSATKTAAKEAIKGMEEATQALENELEELEKESESNNN